MPIFDTSQLPLAIPAVTQVVARYDRGSGQYTALPNVWCESIERSDGLNPSTARFVYLLDSSDPSDPFPDSPADLWPLTAQGPYTVQPDDELVAFGYTPAGIRRPIFNGFAQAPEVGINPAGGRAGFGAVGVEVRCWDQPIDLRIDRNADTPNDQGANARNPTVQPTRFNPNDDVLGMLGNCTPKDHDANQGSTNAWPCFLEPKLIRDPDPAIFWTLAKAVRYLLFAPIYGDIFGQGGVPFGQSSDGTPYVLPPDASAVDNLLVDLLSDGTTRDILMRDSDVSGQNVPDAIESMISYNGFGARFELGANSSGDPVTRLVLFRRDGTGGSDPKDLFLQPYGSGLDPAKSNASVLELIRNSRNLSNACVVACRPDLVEVSIVLAPGFHILDSDADHISDFDLAEANKKTNSAETRNAYRLFIADECGDGHWDHSSNSWVTAQPIDFSPALVPVNGVPSYVNRYRPGRGTLLSRDDSGRPLRAELYLSRDYTGATPAVWDRSGTWQPCGHGNWHLEHDRLGVRLSCQNPESWSIAPPGKSDQPRQNPGPKVKGVTSLARPGLDLNSGYYHLMLVTVIEADTRIKARAPKRTASPTKFSVWTRIEAHDHFRKETVDASSWFAGGPVNPRDDTTMAQAQAEALRAARETPHVSGQITIPYLSNGYAVGDRIASVNGVNIDLAETAAPEAGEEPRYPVVVGLSYWFGEGGQKTTLTLGPALGRAETRSLIRRPKTAPEASPSRHIARPPHYFANLRGRRQVERPGQLDTAIVRTERQEMPRQD